MHVNWIQWEAEALPCETESFDVVLSTLGGMFAPRHQVVADELKFASTDEAIEFMTSKFGPLIMARQLTETSGRWPVLLAKLRPFTSSGSRASTS